MFKMGLLWMICPPDLLTVACWLLQCDFLTRRMFFMPLVLFLLSLFFGWFCFQPRLSRFHLDLDTIPGFSFFFSISFHVFVLPKQRQLQRISSDENPQIHEDGSSLNGTGGTFGVRTSLSGSSEGFPVCRVRVRQASAVL